MDIIHRLFRQKEPTKTEVWGIRAPKNIKARWLMLSAIMRIPRNRLVLFALGDWARANADVLLDKQERNRLADRITELYLNDKL